MPPANRLKLRSFQYLLTATFLIHFERRKAATGLTNTEIMIMATAVVTTVTLFSVGTFRARTKATGPLIARNTTDSCSDHDKGSCRKKLMTPNVGRSASSLTTSDRIIATKTNPALNWCSRLIMATPRYAYRDSSASRQLRCKICDIVIFDVSDRLWCV
eukprot:GFYU01004180.1.p2 GENE.GFYU01004180.1~~GFYU01004180.1.p2  ORF type:complete len:159 (+),score=3.37 GFYU01004180.1:762-1238(+)